MRSRHIPIFKRLAFRIGLSTAVLMGCVFAGTGYRLVQSEREQLTREVTRRVLAETRSLSMAASGPLLRKDPELGLHPLILRALDELPHLSEVVVLDRNEVIQGHRILQEIGGSVELPPESRRQMVEEAESWFDGPSLVIRMPILQHEQEIGTLIVHTSREEIQAAVQSSVRRLILTAGGGMVLAVLVVLIVVTRGLRPLGALQQGVARIGAGDLTTRLKDAPRNELGMLASEINDMAQSLQKAQRQLIQKERLDHEIDIAQNLQATLLPRSLAAPAGYELAAGYAAATEVGGDYYDVIPLPDGSTVLLVADVAGKGVPGLVVMAMTRVILRGLTQPGRTPVDALAMANRMLGGAIPKGMFVTCLYAVLDPESGELRYASAGHCPPMRLGSSARALEAGGKPLGLFPANLFERSLKPRKTVLGPDDAVVLYTDGLLEVADDDGVQLGQERLLEIAARSSSSAVDLVCELRKAAEEWGAEGRLQDDLTLLTLKRSAVPVGSEPQLEALLR